MPVEGGSRPLRACGTRFVLHKVAAMERIVNRFGAYLTHLIAMTEDSTVKAADRQKVKGYVLRWQDSKILLGCAFFRDLLKPCAILCKILQEDEICVVRAIESVMKTKRSLEKMKSTNFEELPSIKMVLERIKQDDGVTYQGVELKAYDRAIAYLKSHKDEWIETCLRDRIRAENTDLLTHAVTLLATNGWQRSESTVFGYAALDAVCKRFQVPLESRSVDCSVVEEEWDDMVDYARRYLNLVKDDYKIIWWKLFTAVDAKNWCNVLAVIELLFCLPISNGHLERVFSQLKLIKVNRQTCLGEDTLDHLIRINVEGPPLSQWDSTGALELWAKEKIRRVNQTDASSQGQSASESSGPGATSSGSESGFSLDDWEDWINPT